MARGSTRLGTWQVLLTISIFIIPLCAHNGKTTGPLETHPARVRGSIVWTFVQGSGHVCG